MRDVLAHNPSVVKGLAVKTHVGRILAKTGTRDRVPGGDLRVNTGLVQPK